jgi:hypothetical protein
MKHNHTNLFVLNWFTIGFQCWVSVIRLISFFGQLTKWRPTAERRTCNSATGLFFAFFMCTLFADCTDYVALDTKTVLRKELKNVVEVVVTNFKALSRYYDKFQGRTTGFDSRKRQEGFYVKHREHNGSEAHPASYPMSTAGLCIPESNTARARNWLFISISCRDHEWWSSTSTSPHAFMSES